MKKDKRIKQIFSFLIILLALLFIAFSAQVRQAVVQALSLSVGTVIPGLFPFLLLCEFACKTGLLQPNGKAADRFTQKVFGVGASCIPVLVFGLTGGYLTGVKTVKALYQNARITKEEAQKLCRFCVSPGLAFAVCAVGSGMLSNSKAGALLFACCTASSLLIGFLQPKAKQCTPMETPAAKSEKSAYAFTYAVQKSAESCLSLSAWMAFFASLQAIVFALLPTSLHPFFVLFFEVTAGALQAAQCGSLPLCAAVLGFGGICIFCQLLPDLQALEVDIAAYLKYRLANAVLAGAFCKIGLFFFPDVGFDRSVIMLRPYSVNPTSSFFLLLMCFIFILDLAPQKKTCYTENGR